MNEIWSKLRRRDFLKACAAAAAGSMFPGYSVLDASDGAVAQGITAGRKKPGRDRIQNVLPLIGTGWHGHMFPGAVAPFGLVQLSPDTSGAPEARWNGKGDYYQWDHCSGYHYPDNVILGFSHTHLQGTGAIDLGDVLVMPLVEGRNWSWSSGAPGGQAETQIEAIGADSGWVFDQSGQGYRSFFSHEQESARMGYYGVHLETPDVRRATAELRFWCSGISTVHSPCPWKQSGAFERSKKYFAENVFIQSVALNGKELTRSWFTHANIVAGGELRFRMSSRPNKQWASGPADRPPSGLVKS